MTDLYSEVEMAESGNGACKSRESSESSTFNLGTPSNSSLPTTTLLLLRRTGWEAIGFVSMHVESSYAYGTHPGGI